MLAPGPEVLLAGLLVKGVLPLKTAELVHLDPLTVVDLVFGRDVVPALAVLALQRDLDSLLIFRHTFFLLRYFPDIARIDLVAEAGLEPATPRL